MYHHLTIQTLQSTDRIVPYILVPGHDESVSSWLVRLARKHYCNVNDFCTHYGISELLKSDIDLISDLSLLRGTLPTEAKVPNQLVQKISNFQWSNGRSNWLIEPNKSGSVQFNSFTKLCISCLKKKDTTDLNGSWNCSLVVLNATAILLRNVPNVKTLFLQ